MTKAAAPPETDHAPAESTNGLKPPPNIETVAVEFRGMTVTIPKRRGRWDIDALVDFQDGKPLPGIKKLIGQSQWNRIKQVCPFGDDLDEFSDAVATAINEHCVA
jgi:hypothetical protein